MNKNIQARSRALLLITLMAVSLPSCHKLNEYFGEDLGDGILVTASLLTQEENLVIDIKDGGYSIANPEIVIPIRLSLPTTEAVTFTLKREDTLLDSYYIGNRFGYIPFPEGTLILTEGTIPAGTVDGSITVSISNPSLLSSDPGYIAAFALEASENGNTKAFGVQTFFLKASQFKSPNKATLSNATGIMEYTLNDPSKPEVLFRAEGTTIKVKMASPVDRDISFSLTPDNEIVKQFYKEDRSELVDMPDGIFSPINITIKQGETEGQAEVKASNVNGLTEKGGYIGGYILREDPDSRQLVSATEDAYIFVILHQHTDAVGNDIDPYDDWLVVPLSTEEYTIELNGIQGEKAHLSDQRKGKTDEGITIPLNDGIAEIIISSNVASKLKTYLYSDVTASNLKTFRYSVSKDGGKTWYYTGEINALPLTKEGLSLSLESGTEINAVKLWDFKGEGSSFNLVELTLNKDSSWW